MTLWVEPSVMTRDFELDHRLEAKMGTPSEKTLVTWTENPLDHQLETTLVLSRVNQLEHLKECSLEKLLVIAMVRL